MSSFHANTYVPPPPLNGSNDSGFDTSPHQYSSSNSQALPSNMQHFQGIGGYSASMLSSVQQMSALRDKCLRCSNQVYALERIGPIKSNIYHKICFKCLICDRQLDLKTFYTNQINLEDRQIYCRTHAPKTGKGVFGADNLYIQNILNAPKLDVMQKVDNKPKANIDGNAKHILHAVNAQHLIKANKDLTQTHHFPAFPNLNPNTLRAREAIRRAQQELEAKQRAEEDALLMKFRADREQEEQKLEQEVKEEWEKRLQLMQEKYEAELKRKNDQRDQKDLTIKFKKEQEDLEKNMTIRRKAKSEDAKRALERMQQEATAHLVTKHSEEMIKLIKVKEAEVIAATDNNNSIAAIPKFTPPPPKPPIRRKRDLYDDASLLEYIDEQAINVAESEQTSYTELVDQLTFGLVTDLEKARAIFRWITVKDLNAIEFGDSLNTDTPLGLLRGIKYGTETYHTLFMRLCSYAGLHCVDIKGHSKSVGYEPGMKIQPGKFTNTWNALLIEGEWRFVQCNWGARHLVMSKDKKVEAPATTTAPATKPSRDKIKYQYDEHYFLPDPEEFILEFFPHNSEWQLLENPITLDEFESLPFVRSLFFHYHLDFVNQRQAVILANTRGACDIKLRMPDDLKSRLAFHFHLRLANKEDNEINGIKLERYVLHTIQDDLVSFNVHVPQTGDYFIEIFASLVDADVNPFGQSFKLKCVCKYKIVCEELSQRMHPLPSCASGEWGPMKAQRHFNISAVSHRTAIIEANTQALEFKFELPKALKIHGKLHNNLMTDLDRYIRHEINLVDSVNMLTLYVTLPDEGQFGFDIYARDPDFQTEKRTMSHCCKYLINYNKKNASAAAAANFTATTPVATAVTTTTTTGKQALLKSSSNSQVVNGSSTNTNGKTSITASVSAPVAAAAADSENSIHIGANPDCLTRLGMIPLSHLDPIIKLNDDQPPAQVDIQFKMSKAVDFSFDLKYDCEYLSTSNSSSLNLNNLQQVPKQAFIQLKAADYVKVKQHGYTICFTINLQNNKHGAYLFTVYASDDQTKAKNLPAVFTYFIKYDKYASK